MTTTTSSPRLRKRPFDECTLLNEFLIRELFHTDYEFGELHFAESFTTQPGSLFYSASDGPQKGTFVNVVQAIFHSDRGLILLRDCTPTDVRSPKGQAPYTNWRYKDLVSLEQKIRARLLSSPFWKDKPLPIAAFGIAVPTRQKSRSTTQRLPPGGKFIGDRELNRFSRWVDTTMEELRPKTGLATGTDLTRHFDDLLSPQGLGGFVDGREMVDLYLDDD